MIKEFVELWYIHKNELEKVISETNQEDLSYDYLVKLTIKHIINKGEMQLNIDKLTVINDGDYQGTQLYIIPKDTYQPSADDYYFTDNYYGSCSGCDTLESIRNYDYGLPNKDQTKELLGLCLNLIQKFRKLTKEEE